MQSSPIVSCSIPRSRIWPFFSAILPSCYLSGGKFVEHGRCAAPPYLPTYVQSSILAAPRPYRISSPLMPVILGVLLHSQLCSASTSVLQLSVFDLVMVSFLNYPNRSSLNQSRTVFRRTSFTYKPHHDYA